jgi:hypothetical protein
MEQVHALPDRAVHVYPAAAGGGRAVFRVASGLDFMVLGEPQILGQMKQAVRTAESAGSLGLVLNLTVLINTMYYAPIFNCFVKEPRRWGLRPKDLSNTCR